MIRLLLTTILTFHLLLGSGQTLSDKELSEIAELSGGSNIIGLGEAEHFYQGYYRSKSDLLQYLIENEQVKVVALEASMSATAVLNDYILGNDSVNVGATLDLLNEPYAMQKAGLYGCKEMVDLLTWFRAYNDTHSEKIILAGIDFQNYSLPLLRLEQAASNEHATLFRDIKRKLDHSMQEILDSGIIVITSAKWLDRLSDIQSTLSLLKSVYANKENSGLFTELDQFTSLWDDPNFPRDSMMFANFEQLMIQYRQPRVALWSANFHLENDTTFKGPKKMGVFIKEKYGDEYFCIAVTDRTESEDRKILYPLNKEESTKYDLILNIPQGQPCERLKLIVQR